MGGTLLQQAKDRSAMLAAYADFYQEIHDLLKTVADRRYAEFSANPNAVTVSIMSTAQDLVSEYRSLVRCNREDVTLLDALVAEQVLS